MIDSLIDSLNMLTSLLSKWSSFHLALQSSTYREVRGIDLKHETQLVNYDITVTCKHRIFINGKIHQNTKSFCDNMLMQLPRCFWHNLCQKKEAFWLYFNFSLHLCQKLALKKILPYKVKKSMWIHGRVNIL